MAKSAPLPAIKLNLLYPQGAPQKIAVKFFRWLLTFGRYIAIVVEIIVLIAFAARFKLDADLADINEKINQQIPFIESLAAQEVLIRQTHFKLETIKQNIDGSPKWDSISRQISAQTPATTKLTTLHFDHSANQPTIQFRLTGKAISNNEIANFIAGLKSQKDFSNIKLTNVNFDQGEFIFTLTGSSK